MKSLNKFLAAAVVVAAFGWSQSASATTFTGVFLDGSQVNSRIFGSPGIWQTPGSTPQVSQLNMRFSLDSNDSISINSTTGAFTFSASGSAAQNTLLESGAPGLFQYIVDFGNKAWMASAVGTMNNPNGTVTSGLDNLLNYNLAVGTSFTDSTSNPAVDGAWVKLVNPDGTGYAGLNLGQNNGQNPGQIDYALAANTQGVYLTLTLVNKQIINGFETFDYSIALWGQALTGNTLISQLDFVNATVRFTGNSTGGNAVPEPATMALLASGAIPLLRRRKKA